MSVAAPSLDAPASAWRAYAAVAVSQPRERVSLLESLVKAPGECVDAALPTLLARAHGGARLDVARGAAALARRHPPSAAVTYALFAELTRSPGPSRAPAATALTRAPPAWHAAIALGLAACARVARVRGAGERERAGLSAWIRAGGSDPLGASVDGEAVYRAWREGRDAEAHRDHAQLLCTAGARPAVVEQLRALCELSVERAGRASDGAAALLAWLGRECDHGADLLSSVRRPSWRAAAARALALTAIRVAGFAPALTHAAGPLARGDALERAVAVAVIAEAVRDARRAPGEASSALGDSVGALADALADASGDHDPALGVVVALLLGRDPDPPHAQLGAERWLTDESRTRLHSQAILHAAPGALDAALRDLEARGVPAAVTPLLAHVAQRNASAVTRARARGLLRAAARRPD